MRTVWAVVMNTFNILSAFTNAWYEIKRSKFDFKKAYNIMQTQYLDSTEVWSQNTLKKIFFENLFFLVVDV